MLHQPFVFLCADTFFCGRTPFNAGRLHIARYCMLAGFADNLGFIRPYLINAIAPETFYIFRIGRPDLTASGTGFLKQDQLPYISFNGKVDDRPFGIIRMYGNTFGDESFSACRFKFCIDLALFSGLKTARTGHHRRTSSGSDYFIYLQIFGAFITEVKGKLQRTAFLDRSKIMLLHIKHNRRLRECNCR
jgi:hypothetical protein